MPYDLQVLKTFDRTFRKLPPQVRDHLENEIMKLTDNPTAGEPLRGKLHQSRSLHLSYRGTQYRVIYLLDETRKVITLQLVGTHENFYKQAERLRLKAA
jgi:addiction module RelE/StbE family toxin